eukprot:scaffold61169_cov17-Tisochrysis_lutea.AAC.1
MSHHVTIQSTDAAQQSSLSTDGLLLSTPYLQRGELKQMPDLYGPSLAADSALHSMQSKQLLHHHGAVLLQQTALLRTLLVNGSTFSCTKQELSILTTSSPVPAARSAAVWPSVREYDKQSTPGWGLGPAHKAALYVCAGDGGRSGDLTGVDRGWRRAPEASAPAAAVSTEQVAIAAAGVQMDVGVVYWAGRIHGSRKTQMSPVQHFRHLDIARSLHHKQFKVRLRKERAGCAE